MPMYHNYRPVFVRVIFFTWMLLTSNNCKLDMGLNSKQTYQALVMRMNEDVLTIATANGHTVKGDRTKEESLPTWQHCMPLGQCVC